MWFDLLLVHQPVQHLGATVSGITDHVCGLQIKSLLDPIDHSLGRIALFGAVRGGPLNVDDDAGVDVDQIICRVGKECWTPRSCGPARSRVGQRDVLRRRANLTFFFQRLQILAYRPRPELGVVPIDPFLARNTAAAVGVSLYDARIDSKPFASYQPLRLAPPRVMLVVASK